MSRKVMRLWLLSLVVVVVALTGCKTSNTAATAVESHLTKIMKNKKIKVAVYPDNPPWSVMDAQNKFKGYEVDISNLLAQSLGDVEVEFVTTDGANRLPLLQSDKVDVVISALTSTNERAKSITFTEAYVSSGPLPLYRKDKPLKSFDDLEGKKVSVARGSIHDTLISKKFPKTEVIRFDTIADAFMALKTGKVDALVESSPIVNELASKNPELEALPGGSINPGYIGMGIKNGDQEWLNYLNNFVRNLNYSGENKALYKKWFGGDLPKLANY